MTTEDEEPISFEGSGMDATRYETLNADPDLALTPEEIAKGWIRCWCEWDGLLIRAGDPEAAVCTCLIERGPL